jgi:hypothetical protein
VVRFLEWLADWFAGRKMKKRMCRLDDCGDRTVFCVHDPGDHKNCSMCSKVTTRRAIWVDPQSLRRRMRPICYECSDRVDRMQKPYREKRVRKDWSQITTPVRNGTLANKMNDQYVGVVRDTIRAFSASDDEFATVIPDVSPAALQRSIETLGLEDEMYAEQRNDTTVLRRHGKDKS